MSLSVGGRRALRLVLRLLSAVLLLGLLGLLLAKVEWRQVGGALSHANLGLVLFALTLNFGNLACKTARWQTMLTPFGRVGYFRLYHYLICSYAASALLPARAGEGLRVYLLHRRDRIPVADSVGVVLVEKLFEILGLLAVVLPLPLLLDLPRSAKLSIYGVAAGGVIALLLITRFGKNNASDGIWNKLARGLTCMREPSRVAMAFGWSVAAYLIDAFEIWLVLHALGIDVPWATPGLVLLGANLAIAIPSTPGQLGALEAGVVAALSIVHVPVASALAFALIYHLMQLLPIILVGLSGLRFMAEMKSAALRPEQVESTA